MSADAGGIDTAALELFSDTTDSSLAEFHLIAGPYALIGYGSGGLNWAGSMTIGDGQIVGHDPGLPVGYVGTTFTVPGMPDTGYIQLSGDSGITHTVNFTVVAGSGTFNVGYSGFTYNGNAIIHAGNLDTDGTLAANSDTVVASQKAIKTYVNALLAANDAMVYKGAINCSTNPNYPAADAGHTYRVSVAGKIGGASGPNVEAGDILICNTDSTAADNHATVGANWNIIQTNVDGALTATAPTNHGVMLGAGTQALGVTAAMTDGQILVGQTSADPLPKTISGDVTVAASGAVTIANSAVTYGKMQNVSATSRVLGRKTSGAGDPEECTLSEILDFVGSAAQGDILYRDSSSWARLAASTVGTILRSGGSSANPAWAADIPQNSQSTAYTLVAADAGKHILHPSADTTARTFTIPANSSVAYPIGTALTFVNQNSAGVVTIAITTDTMRLAGAGTTGSRTLAANGVATALKVTSTEWIISGTGLT